jgi:hypothetical protein
MAMDDASGLDEIEALEEAGRKMMTSPPASAQGNRGGASSKQGSLAGRSSKTKGSQFHTQVDAAGVESLLIEIRDRLDKLLHVSDPSQGGLPENQQPLAAPALELTDAVVEESDELRKAFPHEDAESGQGSRSLQEAAPATVVISNTEMTRLLATVEERVTQHALTQHSSVVVLLGWALALMSAGVGMGYGYIVASGRYPFWEAAAHAGYLPRISAAVLGAPVGVALLPLAGAILWTASKENSSEKHQVILRLAAIVIFLAGILLPLTTML